MWSSPAIQTTWHKTYPIKVGYAPNLPSCQCQRQSNRLKYGCFAYAVIAKHQETIANLIQSRILKRYINLLEALEVLNRDCFDFHRYNLSCIELLCTIRHPDVLHLRGLMQEQLIVAVAEPVTRAAGAGPSWL